jgi:archaellum component FlaC
MNQNNCDTFLQPNPHTYTQVNTSDDLNVGVLYASKKIFDLGVKYAKDIAITIATAEVTILMEASLLSINHFLEKLDKNERIKKIIDSSYSTISSLFTSSIDIIRFIAYSYLTKSWNNFASTNKTYTDTNGVLTQDGIGFHKMLDFVSNLTNNIQNNVIAKVHANRDAIGNKMSGGTIVEKGNDKMYAALRIVDRLTNDIMKLPREVQQDELLKLTNMLKKKMNKQSGGRIKKQRKTTKKYRVIRNMIKRSIRKFSKKYPRLY